MSTERQLQDLLRAASVELRRRKIQLALESLGQMGNPELTSARDELTCRIELGQTRALLADLEAELETNLEIRGIEPDPLADIAIDDLRCAVGDARKRVAEIIETGSRWVLDL